ncbi:regulator of chromosome condensation 1/beta-lactamase-inhibitor protein II [Aspergillus varians]
MSKNPKENKTKNAIYAWGANKRDQLGRRMLGRQRDSSSCLIPRLCIFPGDPKCDIGSIGAGDYHSFAVKLDGYVYAWGYNRYGQTGVVKGVDLIQGGSTVPVPTGVAFWATDENKTRTSMLSGGMGHSVAVTNDGRCLSWGLIDGKVLGMRMAMIARDEIISERGLEKILKKPTLVSGIHGVVSKGMAGPSHSILVTRRGTAYAWGSNGEFEVRQPRSDGVELPSAIQTNELRKLRVVDAAVGRQFSILLAE